MKVVLTDSFKKQIKKIDNSVAKLILNYLKQIENLEDPRSRGKKLIGNLAGIWRYRVGDYRIFCRIVDDEYIIYAIDFGHRKNAYD